MALFNDIESAIYLAAEVVTFFAEPSSQLLIDAQVARIPRLRAAFRTVKESPELDVYRQHTRSTTSVVDDVVGMIKELLFAVDMVRMVTHQQEIHNGEDASHWSATKLGECWSQLQQAVLNSQAGILLEQGNVNGLLNRLRVESAQIPKSKPEGNQAGYLDLIIDRDKRIITRNGQRNKLTDWTAMEWPLLVAMIEAGERGLTREEAVRAYPGEDTGINMAKSQIKSKLIPLDITIQDRQFRIIEGI